MRSRMELLYPRKKLMHIGCGCSYRYVIYLPYWRNGAGNVVPTTSPAPFTICIHTFTIVNS